MGYFEKKYRFMSLGQKQETEAKNMIMDGIKEGYGFYYKIVIYYLNGLKN
jgi:hypothetical protein